MERLRSNLNKVAWFWVLLTGIGFAGCQRSARTSPKAPRESYSVTKMDVQQDQFLSTINIPVSITVSEIEKQLNTQFNGLIYEDNSLTDNDNDNLLAKVWKRGPIRVSVRDSLFQFRVPLKIWVKAGISVLGFTRFQETEFELDVKLATRFDLEPNWQVKTRTVPQGYDWVSKPALKLAGFSIPVTSIVGRKLDASLPGIAEKLDAEVRKNVDLKTPVLQAWNLLRQPYPLSEKYRTWLQAIPRRVLITPFRFENNQVLSTIGIEGHMLTQTGPRPEVAAAAALPNLVVVNQIASDVRVKLLSEATYAEAARLASEAFVGQTFSFGNGAYSIQVTDLDLYGQDDELIIRADLRGSLDGVVYLRGFPYYDPAKRTISLRDLRYDLDTQNVLYRTANWLLKGSFARMLEKQLTFPVGEQLDQARKALQDQLTNNSIRKGVIINGKIDQIIPDRVYLTKESLLAVVYARGHVQVEVKGL